MSKLATRKNKSHLFIAQNLGTNGMAVDIPSLIWRVISIMNWVIGSFSCLAGVTVIREYQHISQLWLSSGVNILLDMWNTTKYPATKSTRPKSHRWKVEELHSQNREVLLETSIVAANLRDQTARIGMRLLHSGCHSYRQYSFCWWFEINWRTYRADYPSCKYSDAQVMVVSRGNCPEFDGNT